MFSSSENANRDLNPEKDVFTIAIVPDEKSEKIIRQAAQLRNGGWLFWPGEDRPIVYKAKPLKLGLNDGCRVTFV